MTFLKKHWYAMATTLILMMTLSMLAYTNTHVEGAIKAAKDDAYLRAAARQCSWLLSKNLIPPSTMSTCFQGTHLVITRPLPEE